MTKVIISGEQILEILKDRPLLFSDIVLETGATNDAVKIALNRLMDQDKIISRQRPGGGTEYKIRVYRRRRTYTKGTDKAILEVLATKDGLDATRIAQLAGRNVRSVGARLSDLTKRNKVTRTMTRPYKYSLGSGIAPSKTQNTTGIRQQLAQIRMLADSIETKLSDFEATVKNLSL